jgi:hypothetical protein
MERSADVEPASSEKTIRIVVPVSSEIDLRSIENIEAFRFDVYWNRTAFRAVDYSPRSKTYSNINGDISIETNEKENAGGGIHLRGGFESAASGDASVEIGASESIRKKYSQRSKQEVLVASGTSHRGTGAFFRFHRSSQEILEGGRELTIKFRVPIDWRAGVLRVDCFATGTRKVFGSWNEPYESSRTFVVPVYLANDTEARAAANEFTRAEQRLRQGWRAYQSASADTNFPPLPTIFASAIAKPAAKKLPAHWVHYLIQSGNDAYLDKYQSRLPKPIASRAQKFVAARRQLLNLK